MTDNIEVMPKPDLYWQIGDLIRDYRKTHSLEDTYRLVGMIRGMLDDFENEWDVALSLN